MNHAINQIFILNSVALGVGLAMDAFSVSMVNGLEEPDMPRTRQCYIAGMYALFQFGMPMIGWMAVHTIATYFTAFQKFIPWIALFLLLYLGISMLREGIRVRHQTSEHEKMPVGTKGLLLQAVATSIDALSVGFTIAGYQAGAALLCCTIIAVVTFVLCFIGLFLGRKVGTRLSGKASILGGVILIAIGLEIFIKGI